jgi:hypothetical protein
MATLARLRTAYVVAEKGSGPSVALWESTEGPSDRVDLSRENPLGAWERQGLSGALASVASNRGRETSTPCSVPTARENGDMVSTAQRSVSGVVRVGRHADQHAGAATAAKVTSCRKAATDISRSEAGNLDHAMRATGVSIADLARAVGVDRNIVYRWIDHDHSASPNLRHISRMPLRLRQALLWPLLDGVEPAPSIMWAIGEFGRIVSELASCRVDGSARATIDRIGAEVVMIGSRLRAMRG